jgi:peptidyl-dipeptidase Dcp
MSTVAENPLLSRWTGTWELPPFDRIAPEHFPQAFETAMAEHRAQIEAIATDAEAPTFANTIDAMERSGRALSRVASTFFTLSGAHTNADLQAIEREIAPRLSAHGSAIHLDGRLFARIASLWDAQEGLDPERARVLERYRTRFVRAGAQLDEAGKARIAAIGQELASLGTRFAQNVLADESAWELVLDGEADLAGLPDFVRAAAASTAQERGKPGKHVVTLSRSSIEPFLVFSDRRDLREIAFKAWAARGENGGETDNRAIAAQMARLRLERAKLLGYETFAAYRLADAMAKTPEAVNDLLGRVWAPARAKALVEREALQAIAIRDGSNDAVAPWDWRHLAEKARKAEHDLDEGQIKPYLQLDKIIAAAFETANRLFGLSFKEVTGLPLYHPDVRAFEVTGSGGEVVGLFLADYFARPSKRSGAWMSPFRSQEKLDGAVAPIIVNVMNFSKSDPALLSFDDARTLFHEFGHALHGLLSDVTYPSIAGTSVARDFVELPSQLYEHWLSRPEILERYAVHHGTGEAMPRALLDKLLKARNFGQGFSTVEYLASAFVDMALHEQAEIGEIDVPAFEREVMTRIGMPAEIIPRHRAMHFGHIFAGESYSAGYYSYLWSEVLDADAFRAFEETGDVFDAGVAKRLKDKIYAAGGSQDPADAYRAFRGRLPEVDALLAKRGLQAPVEA